MRCLRVLVDEMILLRHVQQHRMGDRVLLAEQAVDADAVIADAGIDIGRVAAMKARRPPRQ